MSSWCSELPIFHLIAFRLIFVLYAEIVCTNIVFEKPCALFYIFGAIIKE